MKQDRREVTSLTEDEERAFRRWAVSNNIRDVDDPRSRYDYRGYWKDIAAKGEDATKQYADGRHFPDRYKQHGHPTFSQESQYSTGMYDGGRWFGEDYMTPSQQVWEATHAGWMDSPVVPLRRRAGPTLADMVQMAMVEARRTSRRPVDPEFIQKAILALIRRR